jgi:hypothetical protein
MARAGETPTPEQVAALTEALESAVKPRRRGRPPGQRGTHESVSAAWAGLRALAGSPLPVFGAPYGPGYSQCAAVALAMQRCGFKQCATPAAVANLARQWHRRLREMRPLADALAQFAAVTEAMRPLADAMAQFAARSEVMGRLTDTLTQFAARAEDMRRLGGALEVSSAVTKEMGRVTGALARVGAHPTLPRIAMADFSIIIKALGLFKK